MAPLFIPPTPLYRPEETSSGGGLTAGSIEREHIADPSGVPVPRMAAFGGTQSGAQGSFASFNWAATDSSGHDFELSCIASINFAPAFEVVLLGRNAATWGSIRVDTDGTIGAHDAATELASTDPGALPFDGTEVLVRARFTDTETFIYLDGVLASSGTHADRTWSAVASSHYIGASSTASGERWHGTIRDVRVVDNNDPSNSALFPLDGDFTNQAPGSTVADATATGWVPWAHVNTAATGTYGAAFIEGETANYLAPPATANTTEMTVSAKVMMVAAPSAAKFIFTGAGGGRWAIVVNTNGSLEVRHNDVTVEGTTAAGVFPFDGLPHTVSLHVIESTSFDLKVDGVEVLASSTTRLVSASAITSIGYDIGAFIWDYTYTDHDDANENLAYSLNNTLAETGGGTALTETGTVPFEVVVGSPPPNPVPAVRPAVTEMENTGTYSFAVGPVSGWLTTDGTVQDDFGRYNGVNSYAIDISAGSLIRATLTCRVEAVTLAGTQSLELEIVAQGSNWPTLEHTLPFTSVGESFEVSFTRVWRETAEANAGVYLRKDTADAYDITEVSFTIIEYPNTP